MYKIFIIFFILIFSGTLFAEEKKKSDPKKPKVKTGVELEKGDKAPEWDKKILKKKKAGKETKKEPKEKTKKEIKKETKKEMKELKRERKLEKKKHKIQNRRGKK